MNARADYNSLLKISYNLLTQFQTKLYHINIVGNDSIYFTRVE